MMLKVRMQTSFLEGAIPVDKLDFDFTKQPGRRRVRMYSPDPRDALVSIMTPYHNAGRYFEQTFNSVMNQTFPWFEWVVVNDGSTNQADVDLLMRLAAMDSRIRVIHQEHRGLPGARNRGVQEAKTELVVPLDADDLLEPEYLEYTYWGLRQHPEAAWCYTDNYGFQAQEYLWRKPFDLETLKKENFLTCTAMIRKKDLLEIGGYKTEKWHYHEDWRLWLELLAAGKVPVHIKGRLFWYRRIQTSMLHQIERNGKKKAFSTQIIADAAAKIKADVTYIEYPVQADKRNFPCPAFQPWHRSSHGQEHQPTILWLIPWMELGGADKFNLDAMAGLTAKGYRHCVVATQKSEHTWRQRFSAYSDEIYCLPDFLHPDCYLDFVSYLIQSRRVDVLICANSYEGYYMLPWLRVHFPDLVLTDYVHMEEWYWREGGYARISGRLEGVTEKTWVSNSATRDVLVRHFGREPGSVACLHIGVDDKHFRPGAASQYLHKLLNLPSERPIVLFPCRLHPQKRPFMLLDIAQGLRQQCPKAAFVVVGDGPQLEEMRQAVAARDLEDTVYFTGRCDRMRDCYQDSQVTLICSLKEGLALTAYESCAMGVPVVSSDVGGQRDLIDHDVGMLVPMMQREDADLDVRSFPREEVRRYVDSLLTMLGDADLRERLGRAARQKIEKGFSITVMIEKLNQQLTELRTDSRAIARRHALAEKLGGFSGLVSDYYTMFHMWNRQAIECEEVWNARCWFQRQADEYQRQLAQLQSSIGWRAVQKYRRFVDRSWLGKAVNGLYLCVKRVAKRVLRRGA